MLSTSNAVLLARASLALIFLWFGAMCFTPVGEAIVSAWVSGHVFLAGLEPQAISATKALGIYQIVMSSLIAAPFPTGSFRRIGFAMLGLFSILALTVMFTNPVWIEEAGGFPAIGSGQGILKYVGILGLAMWAGSFSSTRMFSQRRNSTRDIGQHVIWFGLVLVLAWIGGMKFTAVEAQGIDPLIRTSPFFSWMPELMSMQAVSAVIGVIELVTVAALMGYWFNARLFRIGLYLCLVTFVLTLSFLVSFAPSWDADAGGFPALSRAGHFLIKDLALFAGAFALLAEDRSSGFR